ncbi:MAG: PDZ domain-containing protein [Planctomycetota bacterium]|nr:PDZ domain-containing protein [Planctomycetota bacterium]
MRQILWITLFGIALPLTAVLVSPTGWAEDEAPALADAAIAQLVQDLGADDFRTREQASKRLAALGAKARPALEKALKSETRPEVRWRAEQILRRIKGADQERPLGGEEAPRLPGTPGQEAPRAGDARPDNPFGGAIRGKEFGDAMKQVEEMLKKWKAGGADFGGLMGTQRLTAPGLVLERSLLGRVTLRVMREKDDGAKVEDVFRGHSLEDILANNPELGNHAGMAELKRREAEANWPGLEDFRKQLGGLRTAPFPRGGFGMATSSGVEIRQDADGVTVTLREKGEDGKEVVKEYKGKSIEELKAKHPELKDKIGGFSIRVMPPQVFWPGRGPSRLNPFQPPVTPRARGKAIFGLTLTDVSDALASHLGLEKGRGALVDNVLPGSQAEALGLQRNDILVEVGGQGVGVSEAADLLRKAGRDKAPVHIVLIRKGARQTLSR